MSRADHLCAHISGKGGLSIKNLSGTLSLVCRWDVGVSAGPAEK